MPTTTKSSSARQARYRERLAEVGRTNLQITTTKEAAAKLRTLAAERDESPGKALEHVLSAAGSPAGLIGGKRGAQLAQLRGAFETMTSDAGVAAGPDLARALQRTALAKAGADRRARKAGRRNGGGA